MNASKIVFTGIALAIAVPFSAFADTSRQEVSVTINRDASAQGSWSVPFTIDRADTRLYVAEPAAYGTAVSTQYKITSVQDLIKRSIPFQKYQDDITTFAWDSSNSSANQTYVVNYAITPYFKQPVAMYEILLSPFAGGFEPVVTVTYPSSWKLLNSYPVASSTAPGKLSITYAGYRTDSKPVLLMFDTNTGVVQQVGRFTVSGTADEVQKISAAINTIPDIDTLLKTKTGLTLPSRVFIVSDNLSAVGQLGYEAEAVAGNPNVIVFNNKLTKNKSTEELAELLGHELLHLAINEMNIYGGSRYFSPFFDEGAAVYFQGIVHKSVFTDAQKRILNEELGRTHVVGPQQAETLYDFTFDTHFQEGTGPYGISGSYRRAGLTFARFADAAGPTGFPKLMAALKNSRPENVYYGDDSESILTNMKNISGLTRAQLESPGKTERDISGVVSRISHPDNDEEQSVEIVTNYIQNNTKKYFATGSGQSAALAPATPVQGTTTVQVVSAPSGQKITKTLALNSKGVEVTALQTFLETKGFLAPGNPKGNFGKLTRTALMAYQKSLGYEQTGSTGPKTRAAINAAL